MFRADLICDYETLVKSTDQDDGWEDVDKRNPTGLYYIAKFDEVKRWEDEGKKYFKMNSTILVDRFDSLTDDEEDSDKDENLWRQIKRKDTGYSEISLDDRLIKEPDYNAEQVENKIEKLEQKMNELQDDMQSKMKSLDHKLEKVLELLKA